MLVTVLGQVTQDVLRLWHASLFPTRTHQYVGSVLVVSSFLVTVAIIYALGPRLKAQMDDDAAEAAQATMITVVGTLAASLLVVIWRAVPVVVDALNQALIAPTAENGVKLLFSALALAVGYTVSRVTKRFIHVSAGRDAITNHQREVLHHLVQIAFFVPVLLFVFGLWSFPVGNLLLAGGAIGIVAGLAARQTLGAMLAGFVLLFSRPFRIGDWIEVEEAEGIVIDVSIFNTRLRTFDDELVMIPNDRVTDSSIVNYSRSNRLRLSLDVGVDYEADVRRAVDVAVEAMAAQDEVSDLDDPDVILDRFGDSAVVMTLRFWIDDPSVRQKWAAQNAVVNAVKEAFDEEDIKIPFPQRELAGRPEAAGLRLRTGSRDAVADGTAPDDSVTAERASVEAETAASPAAGDDAPADAGAEASDGTETGDGTATETPTATDDVETTGDGDSPDSPSEDGDSPDEESALTDVSEPVEAPGQGLKPAIRRVDGSEDDSSTEDDA